MSLLCRCRHGSFERVSIFIQLNRKRKKRNIVQRNQNRRKKKRRRKLRFYFLLFAEKWNKSEPVYWNLSEDTRPRLESIRFDPICFTPLPSPSPSNVNYAQLAAGQSTLEFYQLGILFDPSLSNRQTKSVPSFCSQIMLEIPLAVQCFQTWALVTGA